MPEVTTPVAASTAVASNPIPQPANATAAPAPAPENQVAEMLKKQQTAIDKVTADAERRVREATDRLNAVTGYNERQLRSLQAALRTAQAKLVELDPQAGDAVRLAQYETDAQMRQQQDAEHMTRQQQQQAYEAHLDDLRTLVVENDLEPTDPRIDWGDGAKTYSDLNRRFFKSIAKINKETVSKLNTEIDAKLKEAEARIKKELGFDSVDTTSPGGATGEQDYKRLRDAWLAKPNDTAVAKAYFDARKRRGM